MTFLAEATRRAYERAIASFDAWLEDRGLTLDDASIAERLGEMLDAGLAPVSGVQLVAAVRFQARAAGNESPAGPLTRMAMARFARLGAGRGRGQAEGLDWSAADRIARAAASDGLAGLRDAAVVSVMSDALLRVSEAAAVQVAHVEAAAAGGTLFVARSKTDQEARGATLFLGRSTMKRVAMWQAAGSVLSGPLFRPVYRTTVKPGGLSPKTIRRIVQRRAAEAGFSGVSGHSLRVGSAQSLAARGATLVEMQIAGRWRDARMPVHYAQRQLASRGAVARLRYGEDGEG